MTVKHRKLDRELIEKVAGYIEKGNTQKVAAICSSVNKSTLSEWISFGKRNPGTLEAELDERLKKARQAAEAYHVANIHAHAEKDWKASAWWLERTRSQRYCRKDVVANEHHVSAAQQDDDTTGLSLDEKRLYFSLKAKKAKTDEDRAKYTELAELYSQGDAN